MQSPGTKKVFIRNQHDYDYGALLDINAHSLFSKWFSESGKLVQALFQRIEDIAADQSTLTIVLIDEVESIAASSAALASGDPGDAVRVVNSVLNCIDTLQHRPNVLILCTSNMTSSIDAAFRDRLDLIMFLGNPNLASLLHLGFMSHRAYEKRYCVEKSNLAATTSDFKVLQSQKNAGSTCNRGTRS